MLDYVFYLPDFPSAFPKQKGAGEPAPVYMGYLYENAV